MSYGIRWIAIRDDFNDILKYIRIPRPGGYSTDSAYLKKKTTFNPFEVVFVTSIHETSYNHQQS